MTHGTLAFIALIAAALIALCGGDSWGWFLFVALILA